jgi:DNA-binding transcriptional LysR family regulator
VNLYWLSWTLFQGRLRHNPESGSNCPLPTIGEGSIEDSLIAVRQTCLHGGGLTSHPMTQRRWYSGMSIFIRSGPRIGIQKGTLRVNLLAAGAFIAALPRSVLRLYADRFSRKALPVDLPVRPWPVAIVTLKNRTLSPVVERFIQCAAEVTKSMSARPQVRKRLN